METQIESKKKARTKPKAPPASETPAPAGKRLIPVLNNDLGKRIISAGSGRKGSFNGGNILILEVGTNLIAEDLWNKAWSQSSVRQAARTKIKSIGAPEDRHARIGRPHIEVGPALNAENPLLDLDPNEQLLFVTNTESLTLLKDLATQTIPGQVLIAINEKIRKIETEKAKPKRSDSRDD